MLQEQTDKNSKILFKYLLSHLETFEKIDQWTDLGNWLQKTAKYLETYPTKYIPHKKILAKRLSQCLNGNLPIGIHRTTLNIYSIILENLKQDKELLASEIYIFSFGLFPFFTKSSIQVKPDLIEIFKNYYLILGFQIVPILSGLMGSLLPALEEQDESLQKQIMEIFSEINSIVGNKFYLSTLWLILLKNSKIRFSCFKMLNIKFKHLNLNKDQQESFNCELSISEKQNPEIVMLSQIVSQTNNKLESYYANTQLIINALVNCLEDEDVLVKKNCLDFAMSYIDLSETKCFNQLQIQKLYTSIIKLFSKKDLSLFKRISRYLFKKGELSSVEPKEILEEQKNYFINGFKRILHLQVKNKEQSIICFQILQNIGSSNNQLLILLLQATATEFLNFCYENGFMHSDKFSSQILQSTKDFIKKYTKEFQIAIESFSSQIQQMKSTNKIPFLAFILRFVVLDANLTKDLQIKFLCSLIQISTDLTIQTFTTKNIDLDQNQFQKKIQTVLAFMTTCVHRLFEYLKLKQKISLNKEQLERNYQQLNDLILDSLNKEHQTKIMIKNFQLLFNISLGLDLILNEQESQNHTELPSYLNIIFSNLNFENEQFTFESLKYLYKFFDLENEKQLISIYQKLIYGKENQYKELLFQRIMELFEISELQYTCLQFYLKFVRLNFNFVNVQVQKILDKKTAQSFQKISRLWKFTSQFKDTDCVLILQKSVFPMISYNSINDPIILNHLNNWLNDSDKAFQIILDSIIKRLLKFTNWQLIDKKLYYNHAFNCQEMINVLNNFDTLFSYSSQKLVFFLQNKNVNPDFDYYQDELKQTLQKVFHQKNIKSSQVYMFFLLKILLRYFVGRYNESQEDTSEQGKHVQEIQKVKHKLCLLFKSILKNLKDENSVSFCSLHLLPFAFNNLNKSLHGQSISLKLSYLNFIRFLLFEIDIQSNKYFNVEFKEFLGNVKNTKVFLNGLFSHQLFIVEEFSNFLNQYNILANDQLKHPQLSRVSDSLLFGYLDSLMQKQGDFSMKKSENMNKLVIVLLEGLRRFLNFYFEKSSEKVITQQNVLVSVFTFGMSQGEQQVIRNFDKDKDTCENLLNHFNMIISRLLVCWKRIHLIEDENLFGFYKRNQIYAKQIKQEQSFGLANSIISILKPLSVQFKGKIVECLAERWCKNNLILNSSNFQKNDINAENIKILELIITLDIDHVEFLQHMSECFIFKKIKQIKHQHHSSKKIHVMNRQDACQENNLLSFLYCYLKYCHFKENKYQEIYESVYKVLYLFENSFNPTTLTFILDILNLMIGKFTMNLNSFFTIKNQNIPFVTEIINRIVRVIIKDHQIEYSKNVQSDFNVIFPLNPSTTDVARVKVDNMNSQLLIQNQIDIVFQFVQLQDIPITSMRYRYFLINCLLKCFVNIANAYYNDSDSNCYRPNRLKLFFEKIWKVFLNHRKQEDFLILKGLSNLILLLIKENELFLKEFKSDIQNIFDHDEFFNCDIPVLNIWEQIINKFLEFNKSDILNKHFATINFSSLFYSKSSENKLKIKAFQRICFIIFCGDKEQFVNKEKLKVFLSKLREVLKDENVHPNLIILILFSLRILILRLKRETLDSIFITMWPSILFLLDKMIKSKRKQSFKGQENIVIACLKLLELISFTDIEEFNLHRWAFLFDYFGIEIKVNGFSRQDINSPFIIKPTLSYVLPKGATINYLSEDKNQVAISETRKIFQIKNKLPANEIRKTIMQFLNYWVNMCTTTTVVDQDQMESLIQGDFIDFKDFINF